MLKTDTSETKSNSFGRFPLTQPSPRRGEDIRIRRILFLVLLCLIISGCATTRTMQEDPLKNTKKLVVQGHVSLYQNGAFRVPNTQISLIPVGPTALELVSELAGMRARQSFETSIRNAADSVYIISEGTKLTYRVSNTLLETTDASADAIRKLTRENSTLLVDRSSKLGKSIIGKSWELSKATFESGKEKGDAIISASHAMGTDVSETATKQGTGLAAGSVQAARDLVQSGKTSGKELNETGTHQGTELAKDSLQTAKDISASSSARSASALKYGNTTFVKGYLAIPGQMKKRAGEMGDSLQDAKFGSIIDKENNRREELSKETVDLMSEATGNYAANVANSFNKAGEELGSYHTTGVGIAALKSFSWVLKGVLWDATIEPLTKMTAASVGYIGVNFVAFPSLVVIKEGAATTQVAAEVSWDAVKMGYDLVAPTGIAAVAGAYSLLDFTGSHVVAGATAAVGTTVGYGQAGVSKAAGAAVIGGSYAVAGVAATAGTVAGYSEAGLGNVAGVVIKSTGYAAGKGVQYIGIPLASAGIALGGGTIGTAVGGAGAATGGTLFVSGEVSSAATQAFGNVIAGATLAGGTAVSAAGGTAYGVYELSKAVVVPAGYEFGGGVVLSYGTLSHISAHAILAVSDCAYMVLSLEGPRWVLYAIKGNLGKGDDLPAGAIVDLKEMQKSGEEIVNLPVSDAEMSRVVQSVYDTLPEVKSADRKKTTFETVQIGPTE